MISQGSWAALVSYLKKKDVIKHTSSLLPKVKLVELCQEKKESGGAALSNET